MNPFLTVSSRDITPGAALITVDGELDHDSQEILRDELTALQQRGTHRLVCDLTAMTFCDSSGMGLFIDVHRTTGQHGGWLRLANVHPQIHQLFRLVALDRLLSFYDSVETATSGTARATGTE
jgi:anti-sigma B factor antagonist